MALEKAVVFIGFGRCLGDGEVSCNKCFD